MTDKKENTQRVFDNHGNITQNGDIFNLKDIVIIFNPFLRYKDSIDRDKLLLHLKYFPNSNYSGFFKIFNLLLSLFYILFILYFIFYLFSIL